MTGVQTCALPICVGMRVYKYSAEHLNSHAGPSGPSSSGIDNSLCTLTTHPSDGNIAITYTVPKEDHVEITIYERGGIIHDRIVNEHQKAGTYTIEYVPYNDIPVLYASIVTGLYRQRAKFINHP